MAESPVQAVTELVESVRVIFELNVFALERCGLRFFRWRIRKYLGAQNRLPQFPIHRGEVPSAHKFDRPLPLLA